MLGVVCLVFMLIHLVPGDPVDVMLGESAIAADREALRTSLGLDRPLAVQLSDYLQGVAVLDLGNSLHARQPVSALLASRIPGDPGTGLCGARRHPGDCATSGYSGCRESGRYGGLGGHGFLHAGSFDPQFLAWSDAYSLLLFMVGLDAGKPVEKV